MNIDALFDRHGIPVADRPGFKALVENGDRPPKRLRERIVNEYAECLQDVFDELNRKFDRFFKR